MKDIEKIKTIYETRDKLQEELKRDPLDEEIAAETAIDIDEIRFLKTFRVEEEPREDFQLRFKMTIKNHELEKARTALNLTQTQFAEKIGMGKATYCQIECCRQFPNTDKMQQIAKGMGKPVGTLFPQWLEMFSERWNDAEKERIVPINNLAINSLSVLSLPSGDGREELEKIGEMAIAKNILGNAIKEMGDRERKVLESRFIDGLTLEETAKRMGVTRERIRQVEAKGLERLREDKNVKSLVEA